MDFQPNSSILARALKPERIREETRNWRDIIAYTYVIQRYLSVNNEKNAKPISLFKIGFSSTETALGGDKNLTRLSNFRTSLIAFRVYRLYVFGRSMFAKDRADKKEEFGLLAYNFEQAAQKYTEFELGYPRVRFSNGQVSEWFKIDDSQKERFLKELDIYAYQKTKYTPLIGTKFTATTAAIIDVPKTDRTTGVGFDEKGELTQRRSARVSASQLAVDLDRRLQEEKERESDLQRKKQDKAKEEELRKTVSFWRNVFRNKTFTDPYMYDGDKVGQKFPDKVIEDVVETKIGNKMQPVIVYAPQVGKTRRTRIEITSQELEEASGYITINEAMQMYFPELAQKYKASFDYFTRLNGQADNFIGND